MKESFIVTLLMFLSGINDHFPESNSVEKNTFINSNIHTQYLENYNFSDIYFSNLYNEKGLNFKSTIEISDMKKILFITNTTEKNKIEENTYIIIYDLEIFKAILEYLENLDFYSTNECIVFILNEKIFNDLSNKEILHYKSVNNFFIITYSDTYANNIINELGKISTNKEAISGMTIYINLTYKGYSTVTYLLFSSVILSFLLFFEIKYVYLYYKTSVENKLSIQRFIIYIMISLNVCIIFLISEISISKNILVHKEITNAYYIIKIIKVLFFNISKNLLVLIFLFISRGYSLIFFDDKYRNKYLKIILIIFALDYVLQIIFSLFGDIKLFSIIFIIDIYNIIYYIVISIFIDKIGNNIKLGLFLIFYNLNNMDNLGWDQNNLNKIKEMVQYKIILRVNILYYCTGFSILGFILHIIFQIFPLFLKGNAIYDIIFILLLVVGIFFIQRLFIPKTLIEKYKMKFEELINGVPSEYLNEYVYKISDKNYLNKDDIEYIKCNNSPIIFLNSFIKLGQNDNNDSVKCFVDKGKLGFIIKED